MPRRTHIDDYQAVENTDDLDRLVKDKRTTKRADRQKKHRRNRHYVKTMLRHLSQDPGTDENLDE